MDHVTLTIILMGLAALLVALVLLFKIGTCSKNRTCGRNSDDAAVLLGSQGGANPGDPGHHHSGHDGGSSHGGDSGGGFDGGGHSGH